MFHDGTGTLAECSRVASAIAVATAVADVAAAVDLVVVGAVEADRIVAVPVEDSAAAAAAAEVAVVAVVVVAVAEPFEQNAFAAVVDDCLVLCLVEGEVHLLDLGQAIGAAFALVMAGIQAGVVVDLAIASAVQAHTAGVQMGFASVHCGKEMGAANS
jgi:hypothetical protein